MCLKMRKKRSFLLWEQGVEGSNPFAPTEYEKRNQAIGSFFVHIAKVDQASVRSTISASGAFFITEAMPFFMVASLAYIWLVPMTWPLVAIRLK